MKWMLLIGLGGALGTMLRYLCVRGLQVFAGGLPLGTLFVNVLGAFLAGMCCVICRTKLQAYEAYFPILFIGFLGGFTTFSAFALECIRFFEAAQYGKCLIYLLVQNVTGMLAAGIGLYLAKHYFH